MYEKENYVGNEGSDNTVYTPQESYTAYQAQSPVYVTNADNIENTGKKEKKKRKRRRVVYLRSFLCAQHWDYSSVYF